MAFLDMLRSERAIMTLLFLGVLAGLLFAGSSQHAIDTWSQYAGGSVAVYNVAKSFAPGGPPSPVVPVSAVPAPAPAPATKNPAGGI